MYMEVTGLGNVTHEPNSREESILLLAALCGVQYGGNV